MLEIRGQHFESVCSTTLWVGLGVKVGLLGLSTATFLKELVVCCSHCLLFNGLHFKVLVEFSQKFRFNICIDSLEIE